MLILQNYYLFSHTLQLHLVFCQGVKIILGSMRICTFDRYIHKTKLQWVPFM